MALPFLPIASPIPNAMVWLDLTRRDEQPPLRKSPNCQSPILPSPVFIFTIDTWSISQPIYAPPPAESSRSLMLTELISNAGILRLSRWGADLPGLIPEHRTACLQQQTLWRLSRRDR